MIGAYWKIFMWYIYSLKLSIQKRFNMQAQSFLDIFKNDATFAFLTGYVFTHNY
jgi:hypothetical protein